MANQILERKAFHAGEAIIIATEPHSNSYIIQEGLIGAFIIEDNNRVEVARYGKDTIIGEMNLLIEEPSPFSFIAITDVTAVIINRQDFEKKLAKLDQTVVQIIKALIAKLKILEFNNRDQKLESNRIDSKAREIVQHLLRDMQGERKQRYEDILMPHFNIMCKSLEELKSEERKKKREEQLKDDSTEDQESEDMAEDEVDDFDSFAESTDS